MRFAGNVIWFVFGGAAIAALWLIGAMAFAPLALIKVPIARAALEMARMSAFPFGKDVIHIRELDGRQLSASTAAAGTFNFLFNALWACTFGWMLFLGYLFAGALNCIFIITIPFALQSFKLAGLSFWPVGYRVVPVELAQEARKRNAQQKLDMMRGTSAAAQ
ncbi:YccF family protein [Sinorhizobium meliloti]|uniref:YccF family protein n=1 Tax=Rhizobium meliloti TaxID=382 RepID=UPI0012961492|nr:YccF family protein [Sinorhizobium meliloti]MQV32031.1 YccF family protein [Sinorhizobium meliloti]